MSLSIDKAVFSKALDAVSSVIKARASIPVLSYVKLEAVRGEGEDHLALTATDLDCFYCRVVEAEVSKEFSCLLPAKLVKDLLAGSWHGRLHIAREGGKIALMKAGSDPIKISSLDAKDFPAFPPMGGPAIATADFAPLSAVMNAAPDSDARLELFDIAIHFWAAGKLLACAGNGRSFATHVFDGYSDEGAVIHIIPPMVGHIARLGLCHVSDAGSFTCFTGDGLLFYVKKLAVKTIDILAGIKEWSFPFSALLIREEFLEVVSECHALRREKENAFITVEGEGGGLKLSCKTPLDELSKSIAARVDDGFGSIVLPTDDLLAALQGSDEETITLSVANPVVSARLSLGATTFIFQACKFT